MNKLARYGMILAALVSSCLLLSSCQTRVPDVTGVEETTETAVITSVGTTEPVTVTLSPTPSVTPTPTEKPTVTPTTVPETSATTVATTTAKPTPKPTKAPTQPTQTTAPAPTTKATEPAPTTTKSTTPRYQENPDAIREGLIQYCKDMGVWFPGEEVNGGGSMSFGLGYYSSDQKYIDAFKGKITGKWEIVSISCWIENGWLYISYEKSYFPTPTPTAAPPTDTTPAPTEPAPPADTPTPSP